MRSAIEKRLLAGIERSHPFPPGLRLGIAVSGGADSVALLLLLREIGARLGIVLSVVHFNHQLREKASDSDEKFVAGIARKFGLPLHLGRADVAAKARREKANLEDAARRARYAFFRKLVEQGSVDRIATAHTLDDQAETVLAHILRGSGLAGLAAIYPRTEFAVRPLLFARRSELRSYLRARKQSWREDLTNRDVSRLRARIRRKLLPLLEKQFQPSVASHLAALADFARQDQALLDAVASGKAAEFARRDSSGIRIALADLLGNSTGMVMRSADSRSAPDFPESQAGNEAQCALGKRVVRHIAAQIRSRPGQWTAQHLDKVWNLALRGANGKMLQLPGGVEVRRERDTLLFCPAGAGRNARSSPQSNEFEYNIVFSEPELLLRVPELGCAFRFRVIDWPASKRDTILDRGTVLDRGRLVNPLVLRNWRPGDRLRCAGHRHTQKLKRLLNEKRVARWGRAGWPVVTSGGILAWARGFPAAADFAADERTRKGVLISEEGF